MTDQPATPDDKKTNQPQGSKRPRGRSPGRPKGARTGLKALAVKQLRRQLSLRAQGVSIKDIATATRCPERTVQERLKMFAPMFQDLDKVKDFRGVKADILDAATLTFLKSSMSPDKLEKASVNNLAYAARQTFDMGRLERGLSTSNVSTRSFVEVTSLVHELSNSSDLSSNLSLSLPASDAAEAAIDNTIACEADQGAGGSAAGHSDDQPAECDKPLTEIAIVVKGSAGEEGEDGGGGANASSERKIP